MPKTINGSVGLGGKNQSTDVMVVQYLLNCVPVHQGGPMVELAVDGITGPKTLQAVRQFQAVRLGFADSRVDVNGQTLRELHKYDPYPQEPFNPSGMKWGKSPLQKGYGGKFAGKDFGGGKMAGGKLAGGKDAAGGKMWGSGPGGKSSGPGKGWTPGGGKTPGWTGGGKI
ncbi:MAG: hypothetical protein HY885_13615 [Deltaproteobacteria bacterium]|nr:hypothetical protein [Deltaproteobacteria bacterium]